MQSGAISFDPMLRRLSQCGWILTVLVSSAIGQIDSTPFSAIDVPIRIGLKPMFDWAERSVDTVFTSEGYPNGWVQPQCDLRYRYRFWRSPLKMKATGQTLDLGFTGFYQIEGSSRGCFRGTILSPWTPSCRCGFEEGARRVEVRFLNTLSILPRYQVRLQIQPQKPQPTDKCSVCFWGQDITDNVMSGLWEELTAAQRSMESTYGRIDLRNYLSPVWEKLNEPIEIPSYGWFMIRPAGLRLNRMQAQGDSLDLTIGLKARPIVLNTKPAATKIVLPPDWETPTQESGFRVRLEANLQFDSISRLINTDYLPVELSAKQGPFRRKIKIDSLTLDGSNAQQIQCKLHLSGKYAGTLLVVAVPRWDSTTGILSLTNLDFDLQTRHRILGATADLFERPIRNFIEDKCRFKLQELLESKRKSINELLQQTGNELIRCRGELKQFRWLGSQIDRNGIRILLDLQGKMNCTADLSRFSL